MIKRLLNKYKYTQGRENMKHLLMMTAASFAVTATSAFAGGIDRSGQSVGIIFEDGDYAEFSVGVVSPDVSGATASPSDATGTYNQIGLGYKKQINDDFSLSLIYDQPYGAKIRYVDGLFVGGFANISSDSFTVLGRYKLNNGFSVHGGLRALQVSGELASIGLLEASSDWGFGGVVGVAYEKPEIALRVALTYSTSIDQDFTGTENFAPTSFSMEMPNSINLDFQSGVAKDTLVFGSIRHVFWEGINLTTPVLGTYVAFDEDTTSYTLGVGRRLNENWSVAATLGYEGGDGTGTSLGPTSGYRSIGIGGSYTKDNMKISAGVRYVDIGDATVGPFLFDGNNAIGVGVKVGFTF